MNPRWLMALAAMALSWQIGRGQPPESASAAPPTAPPVVCCEECCAPSCGGLRGGAALYFLKPHWDNNPAFRTALDIDDEDLTTNETDFDYDYHAAPALWLGFVNGSGLGGRVRWFYFDQSADPLQAINTDNTGAFTIRSASPLGLNLDSPSPDLSGGNRRGQDTLLFDSDLRMNVWDVEVMQELNLDRWGLLLTGGLRYAHIAQNYGAFLRGESININNQNQFLDTGILISGHNFNGAGPTASIAARRFLGNGGLALSAMGRGALLYGHSKQQSDQQASRLNVTDGEPIGNPNQDSAHAEHEKFIPVAELELGVDWIRNVGGSVVFLGISLVGQSWFGAGNAANNEILGNAGGQTDEVSDNKANLGLFGARISAGVGY